MVRLSVWPSVAQGVASGTRIHPSSLAPTPAVCISVPQG